MPTSINIFGNDKSSLIACLYQQFCKLVVYHIYQITKHIALDYMRKKHVQDKWTYYPEETSPEPANNADTPEEAFLKRSAARKYNALWTSCQSATVISCILNTV